MMANPYVDSYTKTKSPENDPKKHKNSNLLKTKGMLKPKYRPFFTFSFPGGGQFASLSPASYATGYDIS